MQKEDMIIVSCQGYMMLGKKKIEEMSPICFIQSVCVHLEEWALFGCARSSRSQVASK